MSNRYGKIFVVVVGDNCKTPAETYCPGDRKVLADRLATNHILLQTIPAIKKITCWLAKYRYKNISYQGNNFWQQYTSTLTQPVTNDTWFPKC